MLTVILLALIKVQRLVFRPTLLFWKQIKIDTLNMLEFVFVIIFYFYLFQKSRVGLKTSLWTLIKANKITVSIEQSSFESKT